MQYLPIEQVIAASGLRLVLVQGFPSPWGQAAKAMMEFKQLEFLVAGQVARGKNPELVAWAGTNSGPVVAHNDAPPLNRWQDILLLLERLAPDQPLIPTDPAARIELFGLAHEICGELGFGWNRRLDGMHSAVQAGHDPGEFGQKYGYNPIDGALAAQRGIDFMRHLGARLDTQAKLGSPYLIGTQVTAVDFYWAAFSNLVVIQSPEDCPLDPAIRTRFEQVRPEVAEAVPAALIEHRDRIMREYFVLPMEL